MMLVFPQAFAILIDHEKGFVDDPKDPGGATNLGVSLRFLKSTGLNHDGVVDARDIRLIKLGDPQLRVRAPRKARRTQAQELTASMD